MKYDYTNNMVRRSRLIIPANVPKYLEKACLRNADALVLDLEDSVPVAEKIAARAFIKEWVPVVGQGGSDVLIRVNNTEMLLKDDIEAAVMPGVAGIVVPKVEGVGEIQAIERIIARQEREKELAEGQIKISVLIESCKGYLNMNEIVQASDRIDSLTIGNEDFLREAGMVETVETFQALLVPRMQLVLTARAYQKVPMGLIGSLANYSDANAFEHSVVLAYKHGYLGASCINPRNVETLNRCFSPSAEELEQAGRLIAALDAAIANGRASTVFGGKMIDYVHAEKAKQVIERSNTIKKFELKKKLAREAVEKRTTFR